MKLRQEEDIVSFDSKVQNSSWHDIVIFLKHGIEQKNNIVFFQVIKNNNERLHFIKDFQMDI